MNLREWEGNGDWFQQKGWYLLLYIYTVYVFYILIWLINQFFAAVTNLWYLSLHLHCRGNFPVARNWIDDCQPETFFDNKRYQRYHFEKHCITLQWCRLHVRGNWIFFMLSPGMLRISLMPTRTALWTKPQIWQFKRPWLQWSLLKGISFILQTMIL